MTRISLIAFLFTSSILSAQPLTNEQMVQRGDEISTKLLQTLGGELKTHMQNGGSGTSPPLLLSECFDFNR